ncbi:MAG: hypothetical protein KBD01_06635 [Acidobacteria bacterium]|nr:hypothetical protein [Acidobacteriota bacterium]
MTDRAFSYRQGEVLAEAFARHGVDYVFIGKSGAIFHGFPDTTQDADLFPRKSAENGRRIAAALRELGFPVDDRLERELAAGKDFVQIRSGPFDLDLVFAPDGLDSYDETKERSTLIEGRFPVASIEDIIRSKRAANRQKDRESLPRLEAFAAYLRSGGGPGR